MSTFAMDPEATRVGLGDADAAAAAQPRPSAGVLQCGGYVAGLISTMSGSVAAHQAKASVRVAANMGSREFSIAAVEAVEASNSGALST
ncbi:hypothetical protein Mkiyose1665_57330 [Mycobacterium kiyosense]|nr:hypothetical protein SRL2020411_57640 [Mycobacterium kiyosense]GLD45233.1 hypothetical protein Mkiyose1665_57330 [Mycobacterium kiyosense]